MFVAYLDVIRVLYGSTGITDQLIDTPPLPDLYTAGAQVENCFKAEHEFHQAAKGFDISRYKDSELIELMARVHDEGVYPKKRKGRTDMLHLMLMLMNNLTDYAADQASEDKDREIRLKTALLKKMLPLSEVNRLLAGWENAHALWEFFERDSDYECWRLIQIKMPKAAVPGDVLLERLEALPDEERKIMAFLIGVFFGEICQHTQSIRVLERLVRLYYRKGIYVERISEQMAEASRVMQDVLHYIDAETKIFSAPVASLAKHLEKRRFKPLKKALTILYKALCAARVCQEEWLFEEYRCKGESPSAAYTASKIASELIGIERHFTALDDPPPRGNPEATAGMLREKLSEADLCLLASLFYDAGDSCRFLSDTAAAACNFEFFSKGFSASSLVEKSNPVFEATGLLLSKIETPADFARLFTFAADGDLCDEMKEALARCEDGLLKLPREENREFFAGLEAMRTLLSCTMDLPLPDLLFVCSHGTSTDDSEDNEAFMRIFFLKLSLAILRGALPQKDDETSKETDVPMPDPKLLN